MSGPAMSSRAARWSLGSKSESGRDSRPWDDVCGRFTGAGGAGLASVASVDDTLSRSRVAPATVIFDFCADDERMFGRNQDSILSRLLGMLLPPLAVAAAPAADSMAGSGLESMLSLALALARTDEERDEDDDDDGMAASTAAAAPRVGTAVLVARLMASSSSMRRSRGNSSPPL